jgi:uncharacterized iron-regulated membrane protein
MKLRQTILHFHRQVGLSLGLFFALLGLTGSVLVFHHDLSHWLSRSLTEVSVSASPRWSVDEIVKVVQRAYPSQSVTGVKLPDRPQSSYLVSVSSKSEHDLEVYVDPFQGKILGTQEWDYTMIGLIYNFHAELWAGDRGRQIIGFSGLILTVLALAGAATSPKWQHFPKNIQIRWKAPQRFVLYDLHKAIGLISVLLLIFLALTGSGINFNQQVMAAINQITQTSPLKEPHSKLMPGKTSLALETQLQNAQTAFPTATITDIYLPETKDGSVMVSIKLPGHLLLGDFNTVYLDQYSGEVLQAETSDNMSPATKYLYAVFMLHTGRYGGLPSQTLYLVVGFVPILLAVTGFLIWRNRKKSRSKQPNIHSVRDQAT